MQLPKLAKDLLKYLPILAVLVATTIGLFIGRDLYPTPLDSRPKTPFQLPTKPDDPLPPIILGETGPCGLSNIYTSLPPKCKTMDGTFIPVPGTSPLIIVTPAGK